MNSDGRGCLGLKDTLQALDYGLVHTLLIESSFKEKGYICANDHTLFSTDGTCSLCGTELEKIEDIGDELTATAVAQGAEVEHLFAQVQLPKGEGVGAILRAPLSAE